MKTYEKLNSKDLWTLYNALDNLQNTIMTITSGSRYAYGKMSKWLTKMYEENKELMELYNLANSFCVDIHKRTEKADKA